MFKVYNIYNNWTLWYKSFENGMEWYIQYIYICKIKELHTTMMNVYCYNLKKFLRVRYCTVRNVEGWLLDDLMGELIQSVIINRFRRTKSSWNFKYRTVRSVDLINLWRYGSSHSFFSFVYIIIVDNKYYLS